MDTEQVVTMVGGGVCICATNKSPSSKQRPCASVGSLQRTVVCALKVLDAHRAVVDGVDLHVVHGRQVYLDVQDMCQFDSQIIRTILHRVYLAIPILESVSSV